MGILPVGCRGLPVPFTAVFMTPLNGLLKSGRVLKLQPVRSCTLLSEPNTAWGASAERYVCDASAAYRPMRLSP